MSENQGACQSEVKEVFDKLISLRDEPHRQFSAIIDTHSNSIIKRINDLAEEVCELRAELSGIKKEKNVLIETVDNLNNEISELNTKLKATNQPSEPEENPSIKEENECSEDGIPEVEIDPSLNDQSDGDILAIEQIQEEDMISDRVLNDSHSNSSTRSGNSYNIKEGNSDTLYSDDLACPECKFELSTKENVSIHQKNVHSQLEQRKSLLPNLTKPRKNYKIYCQLCPFVTDKKTRLMNHKYSIHKIGEQRLQCDQCSYIRDQNKQLRSHKYSIHKIGNIEKQFKCKLCSFKTHVRRNLKNHIKTKHGETHDHVCDDWKCFHFNQTLE